MTCMIIDALYAQSLNGKLCSSDGSAVFKRLSAQEVLAARKSLRSQYEAILIGAKTVVADNPSITLERADQSRIILGYTHGLEASATVFNQSIGKTLFVHDATCPASFLDALTGRPVERVLVSSTFVLSDVVSALHEGGVQRLLVEGGPSVLASFFNANMIDTVHLFTFPTLLPEGIAIDHLSRQMTLRVATAIHYAGDVIYHRYTSQKSSQ